MAKLFSIFLQRHADIIMTRQYQVGTESNKLISICSLSLVNVNIFYILPNLSGQRGRVIRQSLHTFSWLCNKSLALA